MLFSWDFDVAATRASSSAQEALLSALSFEHIPSPTNDEEDEEAEVEKPMKKVKNIFFPPSSAEKNKLKEKKVVKTNSRLPYNPFYKRTGDDEERTVQTLETEQQSQNSGLYPQSSLVGTLDPDGNVEVIFYDAQQYLGDHHLVTSTTDWSHGSHQQQQHNPIVNLRGGEFVVNSHSDTTYQDCQTSGSSLSHHQQHPNDTCDPHFVRPPLPPLPSQLPLRFLRAGKGDPVLGQKRLEATLAWRKENDMDTILWRPNFNYDSIKQHYLHYIHLRGYNQEPCFYEVPAKTNLKALRDECGITVDDLLQHYCQQIEFLWQVIEGNDEFARSIYILDLEGIRFGDFVGDVMDFVKRAALICNHHYPERAGTVFVINVPRWFNMIWMAVKPLVDEATQEKITIHRGSMAETCQLLQTKIPLYNLPPAYGGTSVPLGQSPEEEEIRLWMQHNNAVETAGGCCAAAATCRFCNFQLKRRY